MKDRIKFSDEMLAAVIDGRKTQTRRLIEPQPSAGTEVSVVSKAFPYKLTGGTIPFADKDGCEKGMLKVISVHIHGIHDISTADAIAEGFDKKSPRHHFMQEWINIYGAHNWIENPWVWVIEFKQIQG